LGEGRILHTSPIAKFSLATAMPVTVTEHPLVAVILCSFCFVVLVWLLLVVSVIIDIIVVITADIITAYSF